MMQESSSPFDDAMARPLMDEPVKKRWSWFQSSERSKLAREGFYGNDPEDSDSEEGYNAPGAIQEIDFVSDSDDESEDGQLVLSRLEGGTAFELAILEERRQGISDINLEMRQINEIQKDLAMTVQAQGVDIDDIEAMALETANYAGSGLEHIIATQEQEQISFRKKRRSCMAAALTLVLMVGVHWVSSYEDDEAYNGSPQRWITW